MPKYVIERTIPGAGKSTAKDFQEIAARSNAILRELGPDVQWLETFVTDDKIYCVYVARSSDLVLEHARRGGFPADRISEVRAVLDPTTAEAR